MKLMKESFLFSFFLLFSFQAVTGEEGASGKTLLHRALAEGNIHAFRIEMEKLLNDPAPDFFKSVAAFLGDGGVLGEHVQITEFKGSTLKFLFDSLVLAAALSFPLEKTNKENLTARDVALSSYNFPLYNVLTAYNNGMVHGLYDEGTTPSVWSQFSHVGVDIDAEENPWKQLPKVNLTETPLVQALVDGDLEAFGREWKTLFKGPSKNLFALLHSRGENGETFFHYAAKFQPQHLQGIDKENLTPEQKQEIIHAQKTISFSLQDLFELLPSVVRIAGTHLSKETQKEEPIYTTDITQEREETLTLLSKWKKRRYAVIGASGVIAALTAVSSKDELIALSAGIASGLAIEGALRCYDKFKNKSASK